MQSFPWGSGELTGSSGPREWQRDILRTIGDKLKEGASDQEAIQIATASGHGIGKSSLVSMLILWAMATREDTRGVVTANTEKQLTTKTWPELAKWYRQCIFRPFFTFTATALFSSDPEHEKNWRIDAIPWSESNTEAFAGLHNKGRRILLIFDEASGIPPAVWEVAEGALTDEHTEILWAAFGNPTQNTGRFAECFGRLRHRWITRQIDSRTVEGTNQKEMAKWVADYGEDSDFVKVRVRGIFPNASSLQFIARSLVDEAMQRDPVTTGYIGRTAAVGVDVARFGDDQSVIRTRIGRDSKTFGPKRYRGLDTMQLASRVAEHVGWLRGLGLRVVLFIDGGGVGGGVIDRLRQMGFDPIEVQFGGKATDSRKYANKRAEMWAAVKDWLPTGCLEKDEAVATDLTSVEYSFTKSDQILLESKEDMKRRGLASPDDGDALACTFAQPVPEYIDIGPASAHTHKPVDHDPYANLR